MFLEWKNQYWQKRLYNPRLSTIQCNPYQKTNGIFHRTRTKNSKIYMKTKTPNSQSNLEKEKQSWRNQASWLQTILETYSHQKRMVLAQKQTYRSMGQDIKLKNKPTHLLAINLWQRRQDFKMKEEQYLQ